MQKITRNIKDSLSTQILIGLILGIIVGLFFGEMAAWLNFLGDAFLRLFQMSVIPYIVVSLISSIGKLNYEQVKSIFLKGGIVMLIFWVIILMVVVLFPLGFPSWHSASFFSTALLEEGKKFGLLELFIPVNPFEAMANTIIPSIVTFSIALGVGLIPLKNKQVVIDVMTGLSDSLMRIVQFVAKLTPIGVFAIAATAAGTLPFESFGRLQVYIVLQAALALLLSLYLLPGLVAVLTPLRYRDIIVAFRAPLLTAFATANLIVALPLIIARCKELLSGLDESFSEDSPEIAAPIEVLVPASFVFPDMGRLISLSFIPFAAWFDGSSLSFGQYPTFLLAGLGSFFGEGVVAMRFLLNLMGIPADMIQLYITLDQVSVARFGTLLAGMNAVALALLATCAINRLVRVPRRVLARFATVTVLLILLTLGSIHVLFTYGLTNTYTKDKVLTNLQLLRVRDPRPAEVFKEPPPPLPLDENQPSRLAQIRERGFVRVCYDPDNYPLAYFNDKGDLVGFDIEMAHILARELGVRLEFAPLVRGFDTTTAEIAQQLNQGYCDLAMTAVAITPERAQLLSLSAPSIDYTLGFLVKDSRREEFSRWADLQNSESLRIGLSSHIPYYQAKILGFLPQAEIVPLDSTREFLESDGKDLDAMVVAAEMGSAWTLLYPDFSIAVPKPPVAVPMAYIMPDGDQKFIEVFNAWLNLKEKDGTIQSLFDYWVQGKVEAVQPPRWSIIRDVLHWVD